MEDMTTKDVLEPYTEHVLDYYDGTSRRVLVKDEEIPFPEGKLIVSRTDLQGIITHCNHAFVEMSGYTEAELIGQPHYILRHPDMPKAIFKEAWETVAQGNKWHGYVKNLCKDGCYYWVYATIILNVREGKAVSCTSVRRKPSRTQVDACIAHYAQLKQAEARHNALCHDG
ncbi:aerotaxis receptor [Thiothrix caldifontis]|uniref:Aerotaxis receptor n=1 Tax=Thiothrix caldifontis TaxID=525918 RepID=A0A1H3X2W2_9GAMM|nr:PAS domain-containing protein [Thiothrix caldifontis]SDZ93583.1 aerotaxis receptor [Thiothrix caldifontis]